MQQLEPLVLTSVWIAVAVLSIVIVGSIVQAGLGMGFGLTAAPILALIDPVLVPAPALYLGLATSVFGAVSERQHIVWPEVGVGTLGRGVGTLIGVAVLFYVADQRTFSLLFGLIILFAVFLSIGGWQLALTTRNLVSMGLISGFTGVITSVGAPPLALIYQNRPPLSARPTLAAFFAAGCALSLIVLYAAGWAGTRELGLALFMAPGALLGTWLGRRMRGRFDHRYRPALLAIVVLASFLLIARGFSS